MKFRLRFSASEIPVWAAKYSDAVDAVVENEVAPAVRARGFLTKDEFLELASWKTPRSRPTCERNEAAFVEEVTRRALQSDHERFKIDALRVLDGVAWPTASVILHFCDARKYPILDVRALWSLGVSRTPSYDFELWIAYVRFTRDLAEKAGVSMRTLDRALWQYSKERQRG